MPPKHSNSTSSHGKLKFSSTLPKHSNSTFNMVDPKARSIKVEPGLSSPRGSASSSTHTGESQYSGSTSGMIDPKTEVPEVGLGSSSLKRQHPGTSTSAKKKLKVSLPAQKSSQKTQKCLSSFEEAGLRELFRAQAERRNKARKDNSTKSNLNAAPVLAAIKSNSNPITKSNKINLSDMRQRSDTSASAKKPVKVPIKQEVVQKSTGTAREDSPGFDEFVEKENLSYHVEEDNDVAPDSESEFDFEPDLFVKEDNDVVPNSEDDEDQLDIEDDNTKSNLNAAVASDIIKPNLNPTTKSNKINLSNKRQYPRTSSSTKNKAKVIPATDHNSTMETHHDSDSDSGFEAYYEKEATTLDIEAFYDRDSTPEEDDSDVEVDEDGVNHEEGEQIYRYDPDEDDIFNSDPEDNAVESNFEDSNINSNDEDNVVENNSNLDNDEVNHEEGVQTYDSDEDDIFNSDIEDNVVESNLEDSNINSNLEEDMIENNSNLDNEEVENDKNDDLSNLTYAQLKRMCTDPTSLTHYGTEILFTATMRANFSRMVLDQLDALPLDMVPQKYHCILDQVKREKEMEKFHAIDDLAYDIYFPDDGEQRFAHHRILVYKGNRSVVTPGARYR